MSTLNNYVFGIRAIIEAIRAGKEIEKVLIKKGLVGDLSKELIDLVKEKGLVCQYVPIERINRITRKNHQGALAFISAIEYQSLENTLISVFEKGETPLVLVLDGVTDVRNLGAIARSAECAGVHAIVVPEKGSAVVNADAIKTSAGALHEIPVCRVKSLELAIKYLKNSGLSVSCASEKGGANYYDCNLTGPLALVMGAEDTGISTQLLKYADSTCKIPLLGKIGSLNVSVAAGILLFEVVKQRLGAPEIG
jgi:23S rRNA (guanosine2251-2'-O)-methyltransferase